MTSATHPSSLPLTFADLRVGDLFGFGAHSASPSMRVRSVRPHSTWGMRVCWDCGPGTQARVRLFPKTNRVEVIR